jgi:hypothetical protein
MRKICLPLASVVLSALALGELAAQEFHFTGRAVEETQVRTNAQTRGTLSIYRLGSTGLSARFLALPSCNPRTSPPTWRSVEARSGNQWRSAGLSGCREEIPAPTTPSRFGGERPM